MHHRFIQRREAVLQQKSIRFEELRSVILCQIGHLREAVQNLQDIGLIIDTQAFVQVLDGISGLISTFDPNRDDVQTTLLPIANALDRVSSSLILLQKGIHPPNTAL